MHSVVSSLWPPAGIALFALLYVGVELWPGVFIGAFLVNVTSAVPAAAALGMATGNTLEAAAAALLLLRLGRFNGALERMRDVAALGLFGALLSTLLSATIGVTSLELSGAAPPGSFFTLWRAWWSGDAVGMLVVTPLLLTWTAPSLRQRLRGWRLVEAAGALVVVVATAWLILARTPYAYPIFPVMGWVAFRFGQRGATLGTALVALVGSLVTVRGIGPFAQSTPGENLFLLQIFVALLAVSALMFGGALRERLDAQRRVREGATQLAAAQQLANLGSWHWNVDTGAMTWSRELVRMLGSAAAGPRTLQDFLACVHAGDRAAVGREFDRAAAECRSFQLTARFTRSDLDTRVVAAYGEPMLDETGRVAAIGGICQDLTDQWHSRDAMLEREELLRPLLDRSDVGLALLDLAGRFLRSNRTYERILGYSEDELALRSIADITHEDDWPLNRRLLLEVQEGTSPWFRLDKRLVRKDGTLVMVHNTVSGIPGPDGKPAYFVSMIESVGPGRATPGAVAAPAARGLA